MSAASPCWLWWSSGGRGSFWQGVLSELRQSCLRLCKNSQHQKREGCNNVA